MLFHVCYISVEIFELKKVSGVEFSLPFIHPPPPMQPFPYPLQDLVFQGHNSPTSNKELFLITEIVSTPICILKTYGARVRVEGVNTPPPPHLQLLASALAKFRSLSSKFINL